VVLDFGSPCESKLKNAVAKASRNIFFGQTKQRFVSDNNAIKFYYLISKE